MTTIDKDEVAQYLRDYVQQSWDAAEDDRDYSTPEEVMAWPREYSRGRPNAYRSRNPRTLHSCLAAFFVISEMIRYRSRRKTKRVPGSLRGALLDVAIGLYPEADRGLVLDHVRMRKKEFETSLIEEIDFSE